MLCLLFHIKHFSHNRGVVNGPIRFSFMTCQDAQDPIMLNPKTNPF